MRTPVQPDASAPFSFELGERMFFNSDGLALTPDGKSVIRSIKIANHQAILEERQETTDEPHFRFDQDEGELLPTVDDALKGIRITKEHHQKLRELGMNIPGSSYLLSSSRDVPHTIYIHSFSAYLEDLTPLDKVDNLAPHTKAIAKTVLGPLIDYYQWIIDKEQDYLLDDLITKDRFHHRGEQFSLCSDGKTIILHDTEVSPLQTQCKRSGYSIMDSLLSMDEMIKRIQEAGHKEKDCDKLRGRTQDVQYMIWKTLL